MNNFQTQLLKSADASVTQTTAPIFLANLAGFSFQAVFTGAPVGSVYLQMSNDAGTVTSAAAHTGTGVTNWTVITGSTFAVSGSGNFGWDYTLAGFRWVQLVYAPTSGTGTVSVTFQGKEL